MADGAGIGIGTGIGHALSEIGAGISRKNEIELGLRDKQITALEKNMSQQGYKLQQALGGTYSPDALKNAMAEGSPNRDEVTTLFNELSNNVERYNAYFPDSHPNMIVDRVRRLMGKPPGQGRQSPLRTSVEQQMSQTAEAPAKSTAKDFREQWQERLGVLRDVYKQQLADGTITDQKLQIMALSPSGIAVSRVDYQDAQGKTYRLDQNNLDDMQYARDNNLTLVPKGGLVKPPKANTFDFVLASKYGMKALQPGGIDQETYEKERQLYGMNTDKSSTGVKARYYYSTGQAKDPQTGQDSPQLAYQKAAENLVKVDEAKAAVANLATKTLPDDQMRALVVDDLSAVPPRNSGSTFGGRGQTAMRLQYAEVRAQLLADHPGLIQTQAATLGGLQTSIEDLTKSIAFREGARKQLDLDLEQVLETSKRVPRYGATLLNQLLVLPQGELREYPELADFKAAVATASARYASVTGSGNGVGGAAMTSDAAQSRSDHLLNVALSENTVATVVARMKTEGVNAVQGYSQEMQSLQQTAQELRSEMGAGPPPATPPPATPPPAQQPPANDPLGILGPK